jgi:hypothetical protein
MNAHRNPLEVERLLSENSLRRSLAADRRVSVEQHAAFQKSLTGFDEDFDDLIEVAWPEVNPPSRRKDSEINRVLSLLDNLQTGKELA